MKANIIIFFYLSLLAHNIAIAQVVNWDWSTHAGGVGDDVGYCVTTDNEENIIIVGSYNEIAYFGSIPLTSINIHGGAFIAKMDSFGNFFWAQKIVTTYTENIYSASIDNDNNIYITGRFSETMYIDTASFTSNGSGDIFIAKYSTEGNVIWIKTAGSTKLDGGVSIDCDNIAIYVCGEYRDTITFDSIQLFTGDGAAIFIASLDFNGNYNWVKQAGGTGWDVPRSITIDSNSHILISGIFGDSLDFGDTTLYSNGNLDAFIAKFTPNGQLSWAHNMGGGDTTTEYR
ncbi:MAG: hypothetical protein HY738_21880 [Bacteroidia bacterium]|nr:hypothetical protein [Bacteroidia bacterium]